MKHNYDFDIKQIKNLSTEEKTSRQKDLDLFYKSGFPSKQIEDWKFTDLNSILNKNFENISNEVNFESNKEIKIIKSFEHNHIFLNNGKIISTSFAYEEKDKFQLKILIKESQLILTQATHLHYLITHYLQEDFH